jgi:hypothetical protein
MSVKGFYRDLILLSVTIGSIIGLIITLYYYFTTYDETSLYLGLGFLLLMAFGAFARYRFVIDYVWTLWKRWR